MVSNTVIQNILNVIKNAVPCKCKIKTYRSVLLNGNSKHLDLTIRTLEEEKYLTININELDNKFYLLLDSSSGINFHGELTHLEFLNIQTAILECANRFNETISDFCQNFYN
jgi:hypothetical protein